MPSPGNYKDSKSFLKACIPQLIKEGKEQDQAVAICNSMWSEHQKTKASEWIQEVLREEKR